jgi:SAM-dependent methyltransferase
MIFCGNCGHRSLVPLERPENKKDAEFSQKYAKHRQHAVKLKMTIKDRSYFIDYSRFLLIQHFKYINDGLKILEIGPGFPGIFQQLKLTGKKLELFAIEPEEASRTKLGEYGVELIGDCFGHEQNYEKYRCCFDVIALFNVLYYFEDPIKSINKLLGMLTDKGIIVIDIVNDKLVNPKGEANFTMTNVFTIRSLAVAAEKAGGSVRFIDYCCVKDPEEEFEKIAGKKGILGKLIGRIMRKSRLLTAKVVMKYYSRATQLKYGNPDGQYIRAVISRK